MCSGEGEYLFAPFSVFTIRKVKWNDDPLESHSITVTAAVDNALEPDDLPLSPWCVPRARTSYAVS